MSETKLTVNEIFQSIDGEGKTVGLYTTFIRLAGCNLRCKWCDTCYALNPHQGHAMSIPEIVGRVTTQNVTLTGGEPLMQDGSAELIRCLMDNGVTVNLETNGSKEVGPLFTLPGAEERLIVTMDWKLPASGMQGAMNESIVKTLRQQDVLKFVCASHEDIEAARTLLLRINTPATVYLSPVFGAIAPAKLVAALAEWHQNGMDIRRVRVQLQMHKIIWEPERRGV